MASADLDEVLNEHQFLSILSDEIINDPNFEHQQFLHQPSSNFSSRQSSISSYRTDSNHSFTSFIDDEPSSNNSNTAPFAPCSTHTSTATFSSSTSLVFASKAIHSQSKSTNVNIDLSNCITPMPKRKSISKHKKRKSKRKSRKLDRRSKSTLLSKPIDVNNTKSKTDIDLYTNKTWKLKDLIREIISSDYDKAERARNVLILCHLSFMTSCNLFSELRRIFNMNISEMTYTMFKFEEFQSPDDQIWFIRLKITECILYWIKQYWIEDFMRNKALQKQIELFKSDIKKIGNVEKYNSLLDSLLDALALVEAKYGNYNGVVLVPSIVNRFSYLTKLDKSCNIPNVKFLEVNPIDIAQQITLLDSELFKQINERECIEQKWKSKNKINVAPNILNMIAQFNDLNKWVQLTILNENTARKRKTILKRMITMCTYFMESGNLSSLVAFQSALCSKNIGSLNETWKLLSNKSLKEWENIKQLFGWKMNKVKNIQLHLESPAVPHVGIILEKLFQIDEMNKTKSNIVSINEQINCGKMMMLYEQINNVKKLQSKCYQYDADFVIQKLLINELQMNDKFDEHYLHKLAKMLQMQKKIYHKVLNCI